MVQGLEVGAEPVPGVDARASLGPYALLTKLASGGMATVFVGSKYGVAGFERLVAIKCCHPHLRGDEAFAAMFLDEARLAARIHHPNVVATLDVGCTDVLFIVMEYIEGDSLNTLLRAPALQGKGLPTEITVRIMIDALTGLHAAHELCDADGEPLGLVHRDVSPQNILVGADGVSRITDFGIALAGARSNVARPGTVKGRFNYMAPEQVARHRATRCIDVFAAGIVLWEALTSRSLFRRKNDVSTINAVLHLDVPRPSKVAPHVPAALDAVVLRALARDPAARYQDAAEFADALERLPIEQATNRAVAAFVRDALATELVERREEIREASEKGLQAFENQAAVSDVLTKLTAPGADTTPITGDDLPAAPRPTRGNEDVPTPVQTLTTAAIIPADLEHRRVRALLAALMLLLVGSAVGLLIARSAAENAAPASSTTEARP